MVKNEQRQERKNNDVRTFKKLKHNFKINTFYASQNRIVYNITYV